MIFVRAMTAIRPMQPMGMVEFGHALATVGAFVQPGSIFPYETIRWDFSKLGTARRSEKSACVHGVFLLSVDERPA